MRVCQNRTTGTNGMSRVVSAAGAVVASGSGAPHGSTGTGDDDAGSDVPAAGTPRLGFGGLASGVGGALGQGATPTAGDALGSGAGRLGGAGSLVGHRL